MILEALHASVATACLQDHEQLILSCSARSFFFPFFYFENQFRILYSQYFLNEHIHKTEMKN